MVVFYKYSPNYSYPCFHTLFNVILQHLPARRGIYFLILESDLGTCFGQLSVAEEILCLFQVQASINFPFLCLFSWNSIQPCEKPVLAFRTTKYTWPSHPLHTKWPCNTQNPTVLLTSSIPQTRDSPDPGTNWQHTESRAKNIFFLSH